MSRKRKRKEQKTDSPSIGKWLKKKLIRPNEKIMTRKEAIKVLTEKYLKPKYYGWQDCNLEGHFCNAEDFEKALNEAIELGHQECCDSNNILTGEDAEAIDKEIWGKIADEILKEE